LWENGGPDCLLMTPEGVRSMREMLPQAFGPAELERLAER
jgi:cytidine deaminase